jgi:hypothetical protein
LSEFAASSSEVRSSVVEITMKSLSGRATYKQWNQELKDRLFPEGTNREGRRSDWALFDVSMDADHRIRVLGERVADLPLGDGGCCPATFEKLQMEVETLASRHDPDGDLTIVFRRSPRHITDGPKWRDWSDKDGECPYVALLCYLVLVARFAQDANMGFYDGLKELRRRTLPARLREYETKTLAELRWILDKFGDWIRRFRPHLQFCTEIRYYKNATNIGRLLDETIFGHSDIAELQRAAFAAGFGPESAELPDLASRLAIRLGPGHERLCRILDRVKDGAIMEAVRGAVRDWNGICPESVEEEEKRSGSRLRVYAQSELVWDTSSGARPVVCLVFRGHQDVRGQLVGDTSHAEVPVRCTDGNYVWNEREHTNLDIADRFGSECRISLGKLGTVVHEGFGSAPGKVAVRVYQPCQQSGVWRESRGRLLAGRDGSYGRLVVATKSRELIEGLCSQADARRREVDGVALIAVTASAEVHRLLESSGFRPIQKSAIWLVGGCRLGLGSSFYSHLPPEVHVSGTDTRIEPERWKDDWKEIEPGCFVRDSGRPLGLEDRSYEFACKLDGHDRSLRVRLQRQPLQGLSGSIREFRPVDSFARGTARVSGFQVEGVEPEFGPFDATSSNALEQGEMNPQGIAQFKLDAEFGRYREGGAFILGLLAARRTVDKQTFAELCKAIWSANRNGDGHLPNKAEIRRQREALVALGHAEYVNGRLVAVNCHAVIMPRLRRYEREAKSGFAMNSVACMMVGWTLSDLLRIERAANSIGWKQSVRIVMHEQCAGAWAVPPRLLLLGPPDRKPDALLAFLAELGIPACTPTTLAKAFKDCQGSQQSPDVESWYPFDGHGQRAWEVYDPEHARWLSSDCFRTVPYPWMNGIGFWATRERIEEPGRTYWRYRLVRRQASGPVEQAQVEAECHAAAAWHAWRQWQVERGESRIFSSHTAVQLTCVPFTARPPWWLERLICGHSGFAAEWLTVKGGAADAPADLRPAGYPRNTGNFLPSEHSPWALQARLHGWRDLSEQEAKRLLWPFSSYYNRPDLIQR